MEVKAKLNYLRIAPRKVRMVTDLIRWKNVQQARNLLRFAIKKGSEPVLKLLDSAIASAKNNFHLDENNLFISKITVDEGPKLKRFRPRARGSANEIQKKTSHITIVLDEIDKTKKEIKVQEDKKGDEKLIEKKEKKIKDNVKTKVLVDKKIKGKTEKRTTKIFRRNVF